MAWSLLAFGTMKLVVIYSVHPEVTAAVAYNAASIIFLLYFIGYLKSRFTILHLLALWLSYTLGIVGCSFLYNYLFVLRPVYPIFSTVAVVAIGNLVLLLLCRGILFIVRRKKT